MDTYACTVFIRDAGDGALDGFVGLEDGLVGGALGVVGGDGGVFLFVVGTG